MNYKVIRTVCEHRGKNSYNGYIWVYKYDFNYELNEKLLLKCRLRTGVCLVEQYDKQGNLLREWNSKDLEQSEYNYTLVHANCCNSYKSIFYKGYIWKYKGDNSKNIEMIINNYKKSN